MRHLLPLLLLAALPACDALRSDGAADSIHLTNRTDRPVAAFAVSADELPMIDPQPAMRAADFDARRVLVGETARIDGISGYDNGDDVVLFLYARTDTVSAHVAAHYGDDAAPLVQLKRVTATELRMRGRTVVLRDLRP